MNSRRYRMVITLKSDLCAGSGYSYKGIIDSDVCYDSCGLPYIPGRRLKGCLKEAAELIGISEEDRDAIFGKGGDREVRGIIIENAYLDRRNEIRADLLGLDQEMRRYITPQSVLEQFTTVKAQTRIGETGVALDNTLRYTRTVNHYSPLKEPLLEKVELQFTANIEFPGKDDDELFQKFRKTVMAFRNIGMDRNRGLGSVRCSLELAEDACNRYDTLSDMIRDEDSEYILRYAIRNVSPLIISTDSDGRTGKYISGRSVLGFFAGAYLRESGKAADTEEFAEMFLRNRVKFGCLYPARRISEGTDIYYPAPAYINRLKKTKKYVNVSETIPRSKEECQRENLPEEYASGNGNQPMRLGGKFLCRKDDGILIMEPETELIYHHTKKSGKQAARDGELLYTSEVLREQQIFAGEITGPGKYIRILAEILTGQPLRFGKSKSAQYGTCILDGQPEIVRSEKKPLVFSPGKKVMVVLESDAIFVNSLGYTVRCGEVREQIRSALGICEKTVSGKGQESFPYAEISSGVLTGHYSKWNLSRPAVPIVKAGSSFAFYLAEELQTDAEILYLGENTGEGFGRARIAEIAENSIQIREAKHLAPPQTKVKTAGSLFGRIIVDEARELLLKKAVESRPLMRNPASLGRMTLMLSESLAVWPDDTRIAYVDFCSRLKAIKKKETRKKALEVMEKYIGSVEYTDTELPIPLKYLSVAEELRKPYYRLFPEEQSADAFDREMEKLWGEYLMAILIQEKYNLKREEVQA